MMNQEDKKNANSNENDGGLHSKALGTASMVFLISRASGVRKREIKFGLLGYFKYLPTGIK